MNSEVFSAASFAAASAPLQLALAFGWGFLSSLTPCVFPLIPITLAVFGATADVPRFKAFLLALTYVIGMSVTYTTLGMLTAKAGVVFGSSLGNPLIVVPIGIMLVFFALFSLDVFQFDLAYKVQTATSKIGGKGFGGAFFMGMASGLVAAPCVGPALAVIIGFVASSKGIGAFWGGTLLFVYSLGLGVLFVLLGTFPSLIKKLPRSGNWLFGIKFVIAVGLFMVALFLLNPYFVKGLEPLRGLLSSTAALKIIAVAICVVGSYFIMKKDAKWPKAGAALATAVILHTSLVMTPAIEVSSSATASEGGNWLPSIEDAIKVAGTSNKKIFVDLSAQWCAACKEFDAKTFPDQGVKDRLAKFVTVRIDFTDSSTDVNQKIAADYSVVGLPCLLFLDSSGKEIPGERITGFMEPGEFAAHLDKILK